MSSRPLISRPILIMGCQRSGTTILRVMMDSHPQLLVHPDEPQFILGLYRRFGFEIRDVSTALRYLTSHKYFPPTLDTNFVHAGFMNLERTSLRLFVERYLQIWGGEALKTRRLVMKHPQWIYHLDFLTRIVPDAVILHVVRDPRSNVLSQRNRWPEFTVWDCAMVWRKALRHGRSWAQRNPDRYHEIRFEELVQHTEKTLIQVCDAVGIPFSDSMISFDYLSTNYVGGKPDTQTRYRSTDPTRIDRWKTNLSSLEIRLVEYACRSEMERWKFKALKPMVSGPFLAVTIISGWLRNWVFTLGRSIKALGRLAGWRLGLIPKVD